ncbi:hypothetical protein NDA10_005213 [Ustilago hordei]|nr:hypothetical protein NDA10_005213 [Ustilago hordei]UTT91486.1 hypothetical protein NDA17_005111 [Ustilago hordei]
MKCLKAVLRIGLISLLILSSCNSADTNDNIDPSSDVFITFGQPAMNDTSPYPYHKSISAWYSTFLKVALQRKAWPVDAYAEESDFEPVFQKLQALYPDKTVKEIGDDQWAEHFIYTGMTLAHIADDFRINTTDNSGVRQAITYYRRAANLFKLAYFPWVHEKTSRSKAKLFAWSMDKKVFKRSLDLMDSVDYFEDSTSPLAGGDGGNTHLNRPAISLRVFRAKDSEGPQSVVVIISGLDHYYTFTFEQVSALVSLGYTVVVVPMPGTADSPITGREPQAKQEYWSSILDWIKARPEEFNANCISFWGISTGSYWALRASRVEKDRVRRAVSQGTASHYTFTRAWLEAAENLAYPASLQRALGQAFGYPDPESFKKNVEQFSLLHQGLLDQDGAFVLAVNGEEDTIFPIDDQRILTEHGPGAWLRWFPHMGHNGEPFNSAWLLRYWERRGGC